MEAPTRLPVRPCRTLRRMMPLALRQVSDVPTRPARRVLPGLLLAALASAVSPLALAGLAPDDPPPLAPVQEPAPTDPAPTPLIVSVAASGTLRGGS